MFYAQIIQAKSIHGNTFSNACVYAQQCTYIPNATRPQPLVTSATHFLLRMLPCAMAATVATQSTREQQEWRRQRKEKTNNNENKKKKQAQAKQKET